MQIVPAGNYPIGFKVVLRKDDGSLYSPYAPKEATIKYKPLQWTKPKEGNGPLSVWAQAGNIPTLNGRLEVWRVEYIACKKTKDFWYRPWPGSIPRIKPADGHSIAAWKIRLLEKLDRVANHLK